MKKALTILTLMALGVSTVYGGVFMVEDYTEGLIPMTESGNHKLASVTFELEQPSIIHAITYGRGYNRYPWISLDGDSLGISTSPNPSIMLELGTGMHTLDFMAHVTMFDTLVNPRLQVLVLYNDVPSVSETPPQTTSTENPSIISCGPSVTVPGCCEVVDIAGRKVDCEINGDRIMVNSLSSGTYFAKSSEGRTTKIVKLK